MSAAYKEEMLIKTMKRLIDQREKDKVSRINGNLPMKQRQYMNSVIRQVRAMID